MKDYKCQYAIKYGVFQATKTRYILYPVSVLIGEETDTGFKPLRSRKEYPAIYDSIEMNKKSGETFYVDMIYTDDELKFLYDEPDDVDLELLGDYFFEKLQNVYIFVDTKDVTKSGMLYRTTIDFNTVKDESETSIYYMDEDVPNVVLNGQSVKELRTAAKNNRKVKLLLDKYAQGLATISKLKNEEDITRVSITDNHVNYFETTKDINMKELMDAYTDNSKEKQRISSSREVSYNGLRKYIKERVFGHDNEIDTFSQKIYMNYTAEKGDPIESILLVGPTGVGKTETVTVASEYLGIPYYVANASNIVPQGIKGMSIEDIIIGLYENANCDIERAQRGMIFLDEFDKLNDSDLDIKSVVKNILLTFTAGGTFPVSTDHYDFMFDSSMLNKIYAGVFERITNKTNPIGFGAPAKRAMQALGNDLDIRKKIIEKKYFSQEELTRISTILPYNDLSRETKKDALLHAKTSEFVKKRDRLLRQFGIELILEDKCIDAALDKLPADATGMRSLNNLFKRMVDVAERCILEGEIENYNRIILTCETVENPKVFELMKK